MKQSIYKRVYMFFIAMLIAAIFALTCFFPLPAAAVKADGTAPQLKVHFVNVGQGDCTIIELPDGKTMIIDGGDTDKSTATAILTFIDNTLPDGFKYFDYCIMTHSDSDHCGSLDDVLAKYPARICYRPNVEATGTSSSPFVDPGKNDLTSDAVPKSTAAYAAAIKAMYAQNQAFTPVVYVTDPADESQTILGGSGDDAYSLYFYSPLSYVYKDWNNYSPIMVLTYRDFKFAMSGDAEQENEKEFVQRVAAAKTDGVTDKYDIFTEDFCVNVVKAGHHGSRTSTSQDYLDIITTPEGAKVAYYIMSCGKDNSYGHPHSETVERLKNMGVPDDNMLRTDVLGDLNFTVRIGDDGNYNLFFGDIPAEKAKEKPAYIKWIIVAVVVVVVIVVIILIAKGRIKVSASKSGSGKKNSAKKKSGNNKKGGRK